MPSPFDLTVSQFWATSLYTRLWTEHAAEAPGIIERCYALKAREAANIASGVAATAKSPYGLHESKFDLFADDHPGLTRLKFFVGDSVQSAAHHVNGGKCDRRLIRVVAMDSWYHITNDGGFHDVHDHSDCSWCGIYYLQIGDAGPGADGGAPNGINRFYSPLMVGGGYRDFGNQYAANTYIDPVPRDGLLLLFPSYLLHSALPYRGAKDRVIVSFNCQVTLLDQLPEGA
jgi:uncharacterized protein (TIGR02466 family)